MDIIASILAYLTCVTGIVATLAISFVVCFSTPDRPAAPTHTVATATAPSGAGITLAAAAAHAIPAEPRSEIIAAAVRNPIHPIIPQAAVARTATALDVRQATRLTSVQWHRLLRQERARRLAFQQGDNFEKCFLSYTD
jgi:hypothetical protein